MSTPLHPTTLHDQLIWRPSPNGNYTVKSSYKLASQIVDLQHLHQPGEWQLIWNLKAPPRVKLMVWRACRSCLPTRDQLRQRGIQASPTCVLCNNAAETAMHVLLTCPKAQQCWQEQSLLQPILHTATTQANFADFCFAFLQQSEARIHSKFAATLWSIWRMRNAKLWDGTTTLPRQVIHNANHFLADWLQAQTLHATPPPQQITTWTRPPEGYLKINVDAGFSSSPAKTGFGACCRNCSGGFEMAFIDHAPMCLPTLEGEASGLLKALQWAVSWDMDHVLFEVDSQNVAYIVLITPRVMSQNLGKSSQNVLLSLLLFLTLA